ncbi:hypothetical protein DFH11DRAFT_1514350 [Phellopilus nigrolimitatus]|nr:hypothetical protein DFH11DRAFT_1514350 [Phellopilus nigrolimitatus]
MSTPSVNQIQALQAAVVDSKPPYCAGALPVPVNSLTLFFCKDKATHCMNFADASEEDLKHIADACDVATFGVDQKDVHDETYRKALKLDNTHFATKFSVKRSGLIKTIRDDLLEGDKGRRSISTELYKLNVYGKDSFFKAHQDTPRDAKMFGSLVIVFPTPHEGGTFVLRHNQKEWSFDSGDILSKQTSPSIGYVAFFSDVEHEVLPVTSGCRVTITYNLYFDDDNEVEPSVQRVGGNASYDAIKAAFAQLLNDPTFFPDGGYLGFGLRHAYPLETTADENKLSVLQKCLKGNDAAVMKACKEFSLDASLNLLYEDDSGGEVLLDKYASVEDGFVDCDMWYDLRQYHGGKVIQVGCDAGDEEADFKVTWVTERTNYNQIKSHYVAYGNEPQSEYIYAQFCLVANVAPYGKRATAST